MPNHETLRIRYSLNKKEPSAFNAKTCISLFKRIIKAQYPYFYIFGLVGLCLVYYNYKSISTIIPTLNSYTPRPLILLWTQSIYWDPSQLNELQCEFNCIFTYDRELFNVSDGVMFYWRGIKSNDLPNYHLDDQYWIVNHNEAPSYTLKLPDAFRREVSWPVSYRRDSSISKFYGKAAVPYKQRTHFSNKTRNLAWFVSHCKTKSRREVFADKLSKFIDLDIYGSCGNLTCGVQTYKNRSDTSCYQMAEKKYKFYFSAENSLCNDYITEKVFFLFDFEIIPVVYGAANYSDILPQNSYIDARNFTEVSELADFLHKVGSDEQLYYSYFKWKSDYKVLNTGSWNQEKLPNEMCALCKGLYYPSTVKDYRGIDINEWWFKGQCE